MPSIIKIQNSPSAQNLPQADPQAAQNWWNDLCTKSLTVPNGPARDLSNVSGLSHLFMVKDAPNNAVTLEAVNENPDLQQLYTLAQQGRLLLTPTGTTGGTFQVQVHSDNPNKSALLGIGQQAMENTFIDPRQGVGYWLMRICNTLSGGLLFSRQLTALDQEAAANTATVEAVTKSFLSEQEAAAEWDDPVHLNSLRQAGYIQQPTHPADSLESKTLIASQKARQRTNALLDFADNVYDLFGEGKFPDILQQTSVSNRTKADFYQMTGQMRDISTADMALMAFLTMASPTLDYYQSPHIADYGTLSGMLEGKDLIHDRIDQFYSGMLGDRAGAVDAVYVVGAQAAKKIDDICNNPRAGVQDFAKPIIHGLHRLQHTLQTATEVNERFLQAASLAGHVVTFLRSNPALYKTLQASGFRLNTKLFDQVDNFYQMQVKAIKAEADIRAHAAGFPDKEVPEEILESSLPIIAEARFQAMNISQNGLQNVLPLYSKPNASSQICDKIINSEGYRAMRGCSYRRLDEMISNNAGMFKLCSQVLQPLDNKPQAQPMEQKRDLEVHQEVPQNEKPIMPF